MASDINVLIIDDDEDDYFITSDYLRNIPAKKFTIDWCYNYNKALDEIKLQKHDVYLVDYRLGVKTGIDLIKETNHLETEAPFILLTGKGDKTIDEEAMKLGAFDYLVKSELSSEKLERSIRYSIDRAKTLNELKSKEKKYRDIFSKSSDALFVADEKLHFTEVNQSFCDLLNCGDDILVGLTLPELFTDKHIAEKISEELKNLGSIESFQAEIRYKNNQPKQCIISATKEKASDGRIYYQGIIHDITLIKKAERETLRIEKLAATGRLVRTLAHEVRNPINNINLACEHLRSINVSEENELYYDIIYRNSGRINELIKELLNSSKPSEIQLKDCALKLVIEEVLKIAKDRISLKNIQLNVDYPAEQIKLNIDFDKTVIALSNILINAVEAIEHDNGQIEINIKKDNVNAIIEITDNGPGISEDNLPRLFEPYYTSKRNGIGLGLAATLNIIQAQNGMIEVSSELGKSTSFFIRLPLKTAVQV